MGLEQISIILASYLLVDKFKHFIDAVGFDYYLALFVWFGIAWYILSAIYYRIEDILKARRNGNSKTGTHIKNYIVNLPQEEEEVK